MSNATVSYAHAFSSKLPPPKNAASALKRYNFGSGHNDPDAIPVEALAEAAARVLRRDGRSLAMYELGGSPLGYAPLREIVADKMRRFRGIDCTGDDILITSGSLQGLDLVNGLLLEAGDVVLMERFTYVGALAKLRDLGVEMLPIPLDEEGIVPAMLGPMLADLEASGRRAKYIYTIPTIQNPTGAILGPERRRELIALARKHGTPIVEDECYADLTWAAQAPPALYGMAPDMVIHIGSFSKSLAPALRLGYMSAPGEAMGRLLALKSDGGTGALDQMVAAEYLKDGLESHVDELNRRLSGKLDVLIDALDAEFGTDIEVIRPAGGIFVWARLPEEVDVTELVTAAAEAGVALNDGHNWSVNAEDGRHHVRLCFGLATHREIEEGIARLAQVSAARFGRPRQSRNRANLAATGSTSAEPSGA